MFLTRASTTIKLYIIYGHIGLFVGASAPLKDDLSEEWYLLLEVKGLSLLTFDHYNITACLVEVIKPGKLQLLWSRPEPVAMHFLGHFSSAKQHGRIGVFGASRHGGPLYQPTRTYDTRTAGTEDQSLNTQSWWNELCLHKSHCWPRCKDSDHLEKRNETIRTGRYASHGDVSFIFTSVYYLSAFKILYIEGAYYHQCGQQRAQSSGWG